MYVTNEYLASPSKFSASSKALHCACISGLKKLHLLGCLLSENLSSKYHKSDYVDERHRYIYKVNPNMVSILEKSELKFVGNGETGNRMETIPFMWGLSSIQNSNRALEDPYLYF
ncbi:hypothetical protein ACS0TY_018071 [Phlomoides rotata]